MQPVRQLDQDDADVLDHGQEHLAQVFRLHLLLRRGFIREVSREFDLFQFGDAVYQQRHICAEHLGHLLVGVDRILYDVVQQSRRNRFKIQFQVGQNDRDVKRMYDIGLSGLAQLSLMGFIGNIIGALNQGNIIGRVIFPDPADQCIV